MTRSVEFVETPLEERPDAQAIPPGWKPRVLALACHYCAFAAADLAGVMRLSYAPNVRIVRMPCTGKLDHGYVLRAFERGMDGVFVAGCLEGQCHFLEGNFHARDRVNRLQAILPRVGLSPERLEMFNLSAAMGPRWAEICTEFTERVRKLGPSPIARALERRRNGAAAAFSANPPGNAGTPAHPQP